MKTPGAMNPLPGGSGPNGPRFASLGSTLRQLAPAGLLLLIVLVLALFGLIYATCTQYIQPDQFAVKQVDVPFPLVTGVAGIHTNVYETGVHWQLPGCEKFLIFPKSVRAVTLHRKAR